MASPSSQLAQFVNDIADTARQGGRCSAVDDARCILYDCGNWNSAMQHAVMRRFHNCVITVSPFEASVSGFIVIFDLDAARNRLWSSLVITAAVAAMCIVTVYVFRATRLQIDHWPDFLNAASFITPERPHI